MPPHSHRARTALRLAGAMAFLPVGLAAQGGRAPAPPRWRLVIEGLGPSAALGELRLSGGGSGCDGTLTLSFEDRPPVPLADCRLRGDSLSFRYPGESALEFHGRLQPRALAGSVRRDGEPPARWSATPVPAGIEFYTSAPRFTLTQLVGGAYEADHRLPGAVVATARPAAWRSAIDAAYADAAARAGLSVLDGATLVQPGASRMLGLGDRAATMQAVTRALGTIRAALPAAEQPAFDRVFRARGGWRTDFYAAALEFAQLRSPRVTWTSLLGALQVRVPAGGDPEAIAVRVLHGIWSRSDSATLATARENARRASAEDARVLEAMLDGCEAAEGWHRAAVSTLLALHWVPAAGGRSRSPAELVREAWAAAVPADSVLAREFPAIVTRRFGDPQAVPRYGVPAALRTRLVHPDNWSAERWLERHGYEGLFEVLHRLDWPPLGDVTLSDADEPIRLTSVPRRAAETLNGFLEPHDAIMLEPTYVPVLALSAVTHEWVHLLVESRRQQRAAREVAGALVIPAADPWLAEGLAEAWSEQMLAPAHAAVPLLAVSEREKHARLARTTPDDPHVLGYLIVRAALDGEGSGRRLARLLDAPDLAAVARDAEFAATWRAGASAPDLVLPLASRRFLVPETTFTISDLVPDAVRATIRSRD